MSFRIGDVLLGFGALSAKYYSLYSGKPSAEMYSFHAALLGLLKVY